MIQNIYCMKREEKGLMLMLWLQPEGVAMKLEMIVVIDLKITKGYSIEALTHVAAKITLKFRTLMRQVLLFTSIKKKNKMKCLYWIFLHGKITFISIL